MTTKKTGRNDPCPCGSGKKYKQCCLPRDGEAQASKPHTADASIPGNIHAALEHHQAGRLDQAGAIYRQILEAAPNHPDALHFLGLLAHQTGKNDTALELMNKAIGVNPSNPVYYINLGNTLRALSKPEEAAGNYRKALVLKPELFETHYDLGNTLQAQGKLDEAISSFRRALALKPDYAEAHCKLGNVFQMQGKLDLSVESYRKALSMRPGYAEAHYNLGIVFQAQHKPDEALDCYRKALALEHDSAENYNFADVHNNMGNAYKDQGLLDQAIEHYRKAISIKPDIVGAHGNLLFTLNYHPDLSAEEIYRAYQEYDTQRGIPLRSAWSLHDNDRSPNRRLRVGYVSPDFRNHSCKYFLEPLLAHHDKTRVEVFAYAELFAEDDMTARYRSYADHWIPTKGMSDEALAERIRADGIDILVELAGHTAGNRLLVFARKPAPVSVSWLGYGYTTGLSAIDYYLTDEICVPAGSESLFSEQPWRIATPAYVYRPTEGMGEAGGLPAQERGHVTFGTLTRSVRVNHRTVRVWSDILKAVPNSRLVMDNLNFKEEAMRERVATRFAEHGIDRERLEMGCHSPPWDVLRGIDIGLDCFPHNSGTTLFETLYMGVPYITLAGRPSVGRLGSCILQGVGHPEWVAQSEEEYIAKAVALAGDLTRLSEIRLSLRGQMERSPLMDEAGFARKMEEAYRGMWKCWCEKSDKKA